APHSITCLQTSNSNTDSLAQLMPT
ncbi:hypothetical protein CF326_g2794, partial [Tilletia indica]